MTAYYNEIDPYAAQWLRNLIAAGHIAPGEVDERSIIDVSPDDLKGYTQCHFFAGIGGWSYAARLAGYPDDRELWTGSCPCQPFSVAGKGGGKDDERHLWPIFFDLISARRPAVVMGEQVAAAVGKDWLDGVCLDLEGVGYTTGAAVIPACAVDAPHRRDRLWFVANASSGTSQRWRGPSVFSSASGEVERQPETLSQLASVTDHSQRNGSAMADANGSRGPARLSAPYGRHEGNPKIPYNGSNRRLGPWGECDWIAGADGKARRVEPGIRLLAHGVPARVGKLRAYGNAIVPQVAAEVIAAYMDVTA